MKTKMLMLALFVSLTANALTLDEARQKAREHYPTIRDFELIDLTEQYTLSNASKAWLPQIQAGLQATWQSAVASYPEALTKMLEMQGVEMKGLGKFQYKASIDVHQTIWDGGRIAASRQTAMAEAAESRAADEVELYRLRERVDNLYFGILLMQQQLTTLEQTANLLNANLDKMNSLVRNGVAMQSDADAVKVELLSTLQQKASVESSIESFRSVLGLYIGEECNETLSMPDTIIPADGNGTESRPETALFESRRQLVEAHRNEINKSLMPTVGAFAQGFFGYPGLNYMEAMLTRDPKFNALVGISATWNIGTLYTKKNRLGMLDASRQRIEIASEVFKFNTDVQATRQRHELKRLHDISQSDAEIVSLRESVRKAAEAKLREGVSEPTDLLLRITEEKNARITAETHRIEYLKALYSLQTILNR